MTRLRRIVVSGLPHHITQRGNRREPIFFEDGDQEVYRDLLAEQAIRAGMDIWAYCLMPNHVHLIAVPSDEAGLGRAIGETHRRYTNFINARGPLERPSVSEPLRVRGDGRRASDNLRAICQPQSRSCAPCRPRRRLAVVERARASGKTG